MALIPGGERAVVDIRKVTDYVLDPGHRLGRHKARVFAAALGLTPVQADILVEALRQAALDREAVLRRKDAYGAHYAIDFEMTTNGRTAPIRSLWTIRRAENFPRFVTAFVL